MLYTVYMEKKEEHLQELNLLNGSLVCFIGFQY